MAGDRPGTVRIRQCRQALQLLQRVQACDAYDHAHAATVVDGLEVGRAVEMLGWDLDLSGKTIFWAEARKRMSPTWRHPRFLLDLRALLLAALGGDRTGDCEPDARWSEIEQVQGRHVTAQNTAEVRSLVLPIRYLKQRPTQTYSI